MPVIFKCKGCGSIIYRFERVGQDCYGLPTPTELSARFDGVCPSCGRKLEIPTLDDIKIIGKVRYRSIHALLESGLIDKAIRRDDLSAISASA